MSQYRQVLLRLRQGDSDRDIARVRLMGRPKVAVFRLLATAQGWLQRSIMGGPGMEAVRTLNGK